MNDVPPVGLLLITHEPLGQVLYDTALAILGHCPPHMRVLTIPLDADPELSKARAEQLANHLDLGSGLLVLTDLYGSTPGNIACQLATRQHTRVVSGINLPMLLKVCNYSRLDLETLSDKAISGGCSSIQACSCQQH